MRLLARLAGTGPRAFTQPPFWRSDAPLWAEALGEKERIGNNFAAYVEQAYKSSGPVFACILARLFVFSEARFAWRRHENGRPTDDLFADERLRLLERPWPNGTTGELLARYEQDGSLAGNAYVTRVVDGGDERLRRLRPDWMTIVSGSKNDDPYALDAKVIGYLYKPGGKLDAAEVLLPTEVAHFSPIPDPIAQWRGMSWLTPILREIEADTAATKHKLQFFKRGATTNFVVKYDKTVSPDEFEKFVELFRQTYDGVDNAYKTMHLGGGADPTVVGADLKQLEFKATQGAGETRIAAASGVGAVIANLSEGLQGSSLNAGNFAAARRRFADGTIRPLWRMAAASLESLLTVPSGAELWYDDRDIAFLREDLKDLAEIQSTEGQTIRTLADGGFKPESIVSAVIASDWTLLEHTGLPSVQVQPPGSAQDDDPPGQPQEDEDA